MSSLARPGVVARGLEATFECPQEIPRRANRNLVLDIIRFRRTGETQRPSVAESGNWALLTLPWVGRSNRCAM